MRIIRNIGLRCLLHFRLRVSGYNIETREIHESPLTAEQDRVSQPDTCFLFLVTLTMSAQWASPQEEGGVPAYNAATSAEGDQAASPCLTKADLWGADAQNPYQTHAYELAAKIPNVIHQQPCYCYCDRMGHNSLHSCFENTHGAQCSTCLKELYYSYQQHQKGKTATQIRAGIIKGEWKQIDLHIGIDDRTECRARAMILWRSTGPSTHCLSDTLLLG